MPKRTKKKAGQRPELSRLELDIMDVVWELGDCSSAEVTQVFSRKRQLAPTTIRSVLANLRKKGYLKPIPTIERGFRMRATVKRDEVARSTLGDLVASLFGGSPGQAIFCLLEDEKLNEDDLEEIRRMIEAKKKGESK
ncbi:MAG: BlaI/MecI/CopY family transcriptional regulator [Planctomycetota bacterium]|jgi:predicted transcriptional regulator